MSEPRPKPTAFGQLEPQEVLRTLDAVGFRGDGRLLQLNSYENRVFQVFLEARSHGASVVVAKFYRPGRWSDAQILEEHAYALELLADDVPVVAPLLLDAGGHAAVVGFPPTLAVMNQPGTNEAPWRYAVSPRHAGRHPELEDAHTLRWLGRFLGRLHAVGRRRRFEHRRTLDLQTMGWQPFDRIRALEVVPQAQWPAWSDACERALGLLENTWSRLGPVRTLRIHGDCHPGNILWREEGPHVVDLDDACNGPAIQDLWMLLSGHEAQARWQLGCLLDGYGQFSDFDDRELALVEPLRTLRMIHHSAWIAERWTDPAFPAAFPWFGTPAYWEQQAMQLREQCELVNEPFGSGTYV